MGGNFIKEFVETRVKPYNEVWAVTPPPTHAGWRTFASQRAVRAVAVAPRTRRLWAATWGGVVSWSQQSGDFSYSRYGSEHGLAGGSVSCLCLDASERPWAGHDEGGLSFFDGDRWHAYEHLRDEPVRTLCPAPSGAGVCAATRSAVYYVENERQPAFILEGERRETSNLLALLDDGDGLLLGNAWGLWRLRGGSVTPVSPERITGCTSLARDSRGVVWAGTPSGVYALKGDDTAEPLAGADAYVRALAAGREGVWALTDSGLALVGEEGWRLVPAPPKTAPREQPAAALPSMHAIASHPEESYVIAGTDDLLTRVVNTGDENFHYETLLTPHAHDEINNLCYVGVPQGAGGSVWAGTAGGLAGIGRDEQVTLQPERGAVWRLCLTGDAPATGGRRAYCAMAWPRRLIVSGRRAPVLEGAPLALAEGLDGFAHVLTSEGLWRVVPDVARLAAAPPERTGELAQTPDGDWWAGAAAGVFQLRDGEWLLSGEQPGPGSSEVFHVAAVGGALWAATAGGLWSRQGGTWELHGAAEQAGTQQRSVRVVAGAGAGDALWLARADGVVRYDPRDKRVLRLYTRANSGLVSSRVNSLLEVDGVLWVFTDCGVSRLLLEEES
jgi:ligand-binding sensor domain-containing protein